MLTSRFLFCEITIKEHGFDLVVANPIVFAAIDDFCHELIKDLQNTAEHVEQEENGENAD